MRRILIVESDTAFRRKLSIILSEAGYSVAEAESGESALELAQGDRPDLIFISLIMPGISGLETAVKLKSLPGFEFIPIILLLHTIQTGVYDKTSAPYINDYILKEDASAQIVDYVKTYLS